MSRPAHRRPVAPPAGDQQATWTWEAWQAVLLAEKANPSLRPNPAWQCLRMDAYERACLALDAPSNPKAPQ